MTVKTVYSLILVEYPPMSEEGITIIYHIDGWKNKEMAFTDVIVKILIFFKDSASY